MHLVIVESPTKAKTIRKFLGPDYTVIASMGHVRDLPQSSAEVPAELKKTKQGQLGVDVEHDFEPLYVVSKNKTKVITELKKALKEAEDIYLATDEDREGESISWHLLQILKPKVPVKRMVFHEITKSAIDAALSHPRDIDEKLVRAQETRRILDRLVGYGISPVLWKKITYGLSAGRVQSAALKAIVDRERARLAFKKGAYWDVIAALEKNGNGFEAKLATVGGKRIAIGKDFDEQTGALKADAKSVLLLGEPEAKKIADETRSVPWQITDVTEKPVTRKPPAPFITSSLQQEANRKLGLSSKETMRVAQSLYEQGHITYMRTDSVALSQDAIKGIRAGVEKRFGKEYVTPEPRTYENKSKGAQEAHEAIRPSLTFASPDEIGLTGAERDVYELIWMRTLASQMPDSKQLQVTATSTVASYTFTSTGTRILFPGFLRAYAESADDAEQALEEMERVLPDLAVGDKPACKDTKPVGHETKPPARFTEAGLIQYMEKVGIGRPSTYASIISTLLDRNYVRKVSSALVPTFTGFAVTQYMEKHFTDLVDANFTSAMEEDLDRIAEGKEDWLPYLRRFYQGDKGLETRIQTEMKTKDEAEDPRRVAIPSLPDVSIHVGKFGPYLETAHPKNGTSVKASIPPELAPADLTKDAVEQLVEKTQQGPTTLGVDPATGKNIYLKTGSYGPYLQLGEDEEEDVKPKTKQKRVSVPKHIPIESLDHDKALALLSLPRLLGLHPESGKEIRAGIGRFGAYIVHDGDFRSLKGEDDVLTVDVKRALELLAMPKGARRGAAVLKTIGNHPDDGKPITLHNGKYGAYVKHGSVNATVPKDKKPEDVTLDEAVQLLAARAEKKKTRRRA